jgi:hypothetical protein
MLTLARARSHARARTLPKAIRISRLGVGGEV